MKSHLISPGSPHPMFKLALVNYKPGKPKNLRIDFSGQPRIPLMGGEGRGGMGVNGMTRRSLLLTCTHE